RAVEVEGDARRRQLAILYGTNTLGAVAGAMCATFFLLEVFGTRRTIWIAALLNALIALVARSMSRNAVEPEPDPTPSQSARPGEPAIPLRFILAASAIVG